MPFYGGRMPVKGDDLRGAVAESIVSHLGNCNVLMGDVTARGVWYKDFLAIGESSITGYLHKLVVNIDDFGLIAHGDGLKVDVDYRQNEGGYYVVSELRIADGLTNMFLSRS